jgi:two-component system NtrC family sensor kinase
MAFIHVVEGKQLGRTWNLVDGENVIGRAGCEVVILDPAVSRAHARLQFDRASGRWMLEDLGSTNGTRLNGERLTARSQVRPGDEIGVGDTSLLFGGRAESAGPKLWLDEPGEALVSHTVLEAFPVDMNTGPSAVIEADDGGALTLRLVLDLVAEVNALLDRDLLLNRTLERIFDILPAERGYILTDEGEAGLTLKASLCRGDDAGQIPISRTIINQVVEEQAGLVTANAMNDERFDRQSSVISIGMRSAVCVPITGRDRVAGIIYLDVNSARHRYTVDQLKLLTAVGYHIGLALENVRLHEAALNRERLAVLGKAAAYLSHHIKNMLHAVGAGTDVVELHLENGDLPAARKTWPLVRHNLRKINDMVLNMLAFSKEREPLPQRMDLNRLLLDCLDLERAQAEERGIELVTDLGDLLPIDADPTGLHQVFLNLLDNAMEVVPRAGGRVEVTSRFDHERQRAVVTVRDNGPGIEPDRMQNLFTPFVSSKGHRGTGLGLAVARMITEEHRGAIAVETGPGKGSVFTVTLPPGPELDETTEVEPH